LVNYIVENPKGYNGKMEAERMVFSITGTSHIVAPGTIFDAEMNYLDIMLKPKRKSASGSASSSSASGSLPQAKAVKTKTGQVKAHFPTDPISITYDKKKITIEYSSVKSAAVAFDRWTRENGLDCGHLIAEILKENMAELQATQAALQNSVPQADEKVVPQAEENEDEEDVLQAGDEEEEEEEEEEHANDDDEDELESDLILVEERSVPQAKNKEVKKKK